MGVVRLTMEWSPGEDAITASEQAVLRVASSFPQLEVLYTLSFARGRDAPTTPDARRQFVSWAADLVRNGASYVEATNEPMEPLFWSSADPAQQYADLLRELYPALHRVDPGVTVVAGSLARHHARAFMAELTEALGGRRVADAVSLHYPASLDDYGRRTALLHRCFGAALPVYVTEDGSLPTAAGDQSAWLAGEIELAWRAGAVAWILLQLQDRPDLMPWHTGLYADGWRRRPSYYALVRTWGAIRGQTDPPANDPRQAWVGWDNRVR
jgi:hypothetical protein